jgi:predicted nucleic acid-binding protein
MGLSLPLALTRPGPGCHESQSISTFETLPITERPLTNPKASELLQGRLGVGEREAIALSLEMNADLLLMDELAGRRTAMSLGVRVLGTLGVLLRAKTQELIPAVGPLMDQLLATGFYVDEELAERVRRTAGETVE